MSEEEFNGDLRGGEFREDDLSSGDSVVFYGGLSPASSHHSLDDTENTSSSPGRIKKKLRPDKSPIHSSNDDNHSHGTVDLVSSEDNTADQQRRDTNPAENQPSTAPAENQPSTAPAENQPSTAPAENQPSGIGTRYIFGSDGEDPRPVRNVEPDRNMGNREGRRGDSGSSASNNPPRYSRSSDDNDIPFAERYSADRYTFWSKRKAESEKKRKADWSTSDDEDEKHCKVGYQSDSLDRPGPSLMRKRNVKRRRKNTPSTTTSSDSSEDSD